MRKLADLFGPQLAGPRSRPRVLMHIDDSGMFPDGRTAGHFVCLRCKSDEWLAASLTEMRRGLPCPTCNSPARQDSEQPAKGTDRG